MGVCVHSCMVTSLRRAKEKGTKSEELVRAQRLREDVSDVLGGRDVGELDNAGLDLLDEEVDPGDVVLHSFVVTAIVFCQCDHGGVVGEDWSGLQLGETEFSEELS
jgi:hypothetical protein